MKSSKTAVGSLVLIAVLFQLAAAQIKTKTHYPAPNSGNLLVETGYNSSQQQYGYNRESHYAHNEFDSNYNTNYNAGYNNNYNNNGNTHSQYADFVPAQTYPGPGVGNSQFLPLPMTRRPVILDPIADFINKTRSGMASGVCYKEVPTASLVHDGSVTVIGNGTTPNMSKIQVCCDGYERNPHVWKRCDPICKDDCPNGICTAPNTCVCIPGHVSDHEERCITTCPLGCGNGVCDAAGQCQCKPGFKLEADTRKYCVPHCEPGCQFGICVAPNRCACRDGYRLAANGVCEPKCDSCEHGRCTAPGVCVCNGGYQKNATSVCQPICSLGCARGRCVAPDTCECNKGYQLDRSGANCVPHCDQPCLNGSCLGDNVCSCNPGYVADELDRSVCKAHCPQGCPNGFCSAPNFCVCQPGYTKSGIKGRQTCTPA